jgi:hypothetical protein
LKIPIEAKIAKALIADFDFLVTDFNFTPIFDPKLSTASDSACLLETTLVAKYLKDNLRISVHWEPRDRFPEVYLDVLDLERLYPMNVLYGCTLGGLAEQIKPDSDPLYRLSNREHVLDLGPYYFSSKFSECLRTIGMPFLKGDAEWLKQYARY